MAYALPQSVEDLPPSIVLIGVPNRRALERVIEKLRLHRIEFSPFFESDGDMGLSAVATVPLSEDERALLQNYKLWNESDFSIARSSVVRAPSLQGEGGRGFESFRVSQRSGNMRACPDSGTCEVVRQG